MMLKHRLPGLRLATHLVGSIMVWPGIIYDQSTELMIEQGNDWLTLRWFSYRPKRRVSGRQRMSTLNPCCRRLFGLHGVRALPWPAKALDVSSMRTFGMS